MGQLVEMSSDRMVAVRVFQGEIDRINLMITEGNHDAEFLQQIINYLEMRIASMREKRWYR